MPPASGPAITPVAPVIRSRGRSGARRVGRRPTPLVIAGAILVVAAVFAFSFVSLRGGFGLASPSPSAVAGSSTGPVASPSLVISPPPSAIPTPTPSSTPTPSPTPTPTPTASPSPSPTPSPSVPAAYQGLKPCPGTPACYLYRVQSGDSLTKIAAKFGITIAALKKANPEITDPSLLHVGDRIRIPLPKG